jgi:hypothetical protein
LLLLLCAEAVPKLVVVAEQLLLQLVRLVLVLQLVDLLEVEQTILLV